MTHSEYDYAYVKNVYASVQVAKIIAATVVICSVIICFFLLASAYITANASCKQLEQELEILGEVADRFQPPLQPEALVQEAPSHQESSRREPLRAEESKSKQRAIETNSIVESSDSDDSDASESEEGENNDKTIHFKLPLQLDFDDLAGALIEKNQRSKMNCIVEKKKAEQLVDHQPKTVALPFGLNLTTDPRFERVTGERMAIFCESGTAQRAIPNREEEQENNEDEGQDEETIMIQPVMIPIPQTQFSTHMAQRVIPQQAPPQILSQHMAPQHLIPQRVMHSQMVPQQVVHQMPQPQPQPIQVQERILFQPHQIPHPFRPYPPPPMETMRPPMPHPHMMQQPQQSTNEFPPNPVLRQIAQHIIAQKIMEAQRQREEQHNQEQARQEEVPSEERIMRFPVSDNMVAHRIPIPEAVLNHLNSLSANREVIVAVAEQPSSEEQQTEEIHDEKPQEVRVVQEPRTNPSEMNGRQTYGRAMPIDIPEQMMKQEEEQQEPEAQATEGMRPHYVQPRSVRSKRAVDALLQKASKRVKRCSCDCSC
ncbi:hypothetical protein WA026_016366 [Henosepilachna vigintioctopunctata]|uniref:Uncharacterized protein n=1 Tax=Henosepilachna vigintioctopunctata TaxID=420089 RepID=A0AAW1ULZ9_9CUCU